MQPTVNSTSPSAVAGHSAQALNGSGLEQHPEPATQRPSHSLRSQGRRATSGPLGVSQDTGEAPRQSARATRSGSGAMRISLSDTLAAEAAAQATRAPGARLSGGGNEAGPSLLDARRANANEQPRRARQADTGKQIQAQPEQPSQSTLPRGGPGRHDAEASSSGTKDIIEAPRQNPPHSPRGVATLARGDSPSFRDWLPAQADSAGLQRSTAGRFRGALGDIERIRPPQPPQAPAISLDAKGRANFGDFTPGSLGDLLKITLGRPDMRYLAQHSHANGQDHLLLTQAGHVLHLSQSSTAFTVLRSSQAEVGPGERAGHGLALEGRSISVSGANRTQGGEPLQATGKVHVGQLTGIHEDRDGEQLRLHDNRLYHYNAPTQSWISPPGSEAIAFSHLSSEGNGHIYARSGDSLVDLTNDAQLPHATVKDLQAYSVARDGTAALLSGGETQHVHLYDMNRAQPAALRQLTLELDAGRFEANSVGLGHTHLYVTDQAGKLYSVPRQALDAGEPLHLTPETAYRHPGGAFGTTHKAEGFLNDGDGQLHLLVIDGGGQRHAHPLDEQAHTLKAGWTLSDALAVDNRRGLPAAAEPAPENTLHLDRNGQIGLENQRIHRWDSTTQSWKDTGIGEVEQLRRGIDSNAYMLKGGQISKLDVGPEHPSRHVDGHHILAPTPSTTKVGEGTPIEGLEGRTITAFAMLDPKQFVALDDTGKVTAHHKSGEPTALPRDGLEGQIAHLAFDQDHNLHAQSEDGRLFRLDREDWQSKPGERPEAAWRAVSTPGGRPLERIHSGDDNHLTVVLKDSSEGSLHLRGSEWKAVSPRHGDHNALTELFDQIRGGIKTRKIPVSAGTGRFNANLLGRGGLDTGNRSSTSEFIRAHVFKPTLEVPRFMVNAGHNLQHRYQGRDGLRPVYDAESSLFKRLELLDEARETPAPGNDLKGRIARLDLGETGKALLDELEAFREEVENNSHRTAIQLGRKHGQLPTLRQHDGLLNVHGEVAEPSKRTQLGVKLASLSEKLNFNSSGHDLLKELRGALRHIAPSADNPTDRLLEKLQDKGMKLSHQKADVPFGQRRDASDSTALTKARLALDIVTLKDIGDLLGKIDMLTPGADNTVQVSELKEALGKLRDKQYGEHPIKQVTDMGFTEHSGLEASYDGVKAFLKGFTQDDHAISTNMRAATGSKSREELADKLKATFKQLVHPDDDIAITRSYGGSLSTPFISLAGQGNGPWPSGSVSAGRTYMMGAERGDGGVLFSLLREGSGSLTAGVGGGRDYWPQITDAPTDPVDLGNGRTLTPALRLNGDISATATGIFRDGVVFTIADAEVDQFVDNLFTGKLNPLDVMNKGYDHEIQKGRRFTFDINASLNADFRGTVNLSEAGSSPLSAVARAGTGATVTVNLMNYTDYSLISTGRDAERREGGANRPRLLNQGSADLYARGQLVGGHSQPQPGVSQPAAQAATTNLGGTVGVSFDAKTIKRVKFYFKEGQAQTTADVTKLATQLGKAFKDKASSAELTRLADHTQAQYAGASSKKKIDLHLQGLERHFAGKTPENDDQYSALRDLKKALVRHAAAEQKHAILENARFESSYTSLSRLDEQSIVSKLLSVVSPMHAPSNAERVAELLDKAPALKSLVKDIQGSEGTLARVRLEFKDAIQDRIDEGSRNGSITQQDVIDLLGNRENMRIKAITVFHSVSQPESFSSPLPVVGYNSSSSLSVNTVQQKINFSYGQDQDTPKSYFVDGRMAKPGADLKNAASTLKKSGFELNG